MLGKPLCEAVVNKMGIIPKSILVLGGNRHAVPSRGSPTLTLAKERECVQVSCENYVF